MPNSVKGLLRIVKTHPEYETRLVELIKSYPVSNIGLWAVAQLSGIHTTEGLAAHRSLLDSYAKQDENKKLKTLASQSLKK